MKVNSINLDSFNRTQGHFNNIPLPPQGHQIDNRNMMNVMKQIKGNNNNGNMNMNNNSNNNIAKKPCNKKKGNLK